jgi:penicillin-binding protein 1A
MGSSAQETGGGLSLPVWISYMEHALKGVPVVQYAPPEGVVNVGGEWYYSEYAHGEGVSSLGMDDSGTGQGSKAANTRILPPSEERSRILDLFRN